jgi:hypothetical protein
MKGICGFRYDQCFDYIRRHRLNRKDFHIIMEVRDFNGFQGELLCLPRCFANKTRKWHDLLEVLENMKRVTITYVSEKEEMEWKE